jgi:hypothetical protein
MMPYICLRCCVQRTVQFRQTKKFRFKRKIDDESVERKGQFGGIERIAPRDVVHAAFLFRLRGSSRPARRWPRNGATGAENPGLPPRTSGGSSDSNSGKKAGAAAHCRQRTKSCRATGASRSSKPCGDAFQFAQSAAGISRGASGTGHPSWKKPGRSECPECFGSHVQGGAGW